MKKQDQTRSTLIANVVGVPTETKKKVRKRKVTKRVKLCNDCRECIRKGIAADPFVSDIRRDLGSVEEFKMSIFNLLNSAAYNVKMTDILERYLLPSVTEQNRQAGEDLRQYLQDAGTAFRMLVQMKQE